MTPSAQLAEIRERIAQMTPVDREGMQILSQRLRDVIKDEVGSENDFARLALALVSAELAAETKA